MPDNTTLNTGAGGDVIATDDIAGVKHQRIKLEWGPDGTVNEVDDTGGKRVPVNVAQCAQLPGALGANSGLKVDEVTNRFVTLQSSQVSAITNTTTTRATTAGLEQFTDIDIEINITNGGAATGTLQLFLQDSRDNGLTFDDLLSSNPFTFGTAAGPATKFIFTISGRIASSRTQGAAPQQEQLAQGTVRSGPWGDRIQVREKVSGVSGTPTGVTYTITAVMKR